MKNKLWCTNFSEFKKLAINNGWDKNVPSDIAVISINNSADIKDQDEYHVCKDANNVLNLDFDDCSPLTYKIEATAENYEIEEGKFVQFFTPEMAKKSIEFIKKNKFKNFYIHCTAGMSRSQAFVRFFLNNIHVAGWETNPSNPCLYPNGFVYQRLMEAYREDNNK